MGGVAAFWALIPSSVKLALLVGVSSLAIGGTLGYRLEKSFSDARWYKAQATSAKHTVEVLQDRNRVITEAADNDAGRAVQAQIDLAQVKEQRDALAKQVSDGPCLDAAGTDGVRKLWGLAPATQGTRPDSHR